jgi:hypothetical protein
VDLIKINHDSLLKIGLVAKRHVHENESLKVHCSWFSRLVFGSAGTVLVPSLHLLRIKLDGGDQLQTNWRRNADLGLLRRFLELTTRVVNCY